jgi:hypothetical protein
MANSFKQRIEGPRPEGGRPIFPIFQIFKPLRLLRFAALYLFALPIALLAQAAVEYALKSAGSVSASGGNATVAGCRMDSALLTCISHAYPQTTILIVVVCLLDACTPAH